MACLLKWSYLKHKGIAFELSCVYCHPECIYGRYACANSLNLDTMWNGDFNSMKNKMPLQQENKLKPMNDTC